ncbi:MAG: Na+/H+ antiporter NhaA [Alphaproteobacteria bacterium]|nr:Na+/H+ antiporter NhaA [Alphaproteobacteria bacterium]HEC01525.1 Na+/H+ antiporter NhaA [Sphingomonadales bacterium]
MTRVTNFIRDFVRQESFAGLLLMATALLAIIITNSPVRGYYEALLGTPVVVQVGALEIAKPLLLWVNDGLMAVFFFLIGLELKREFLVGELNKPQNVILPAVGAIGGMFAPALVYILFNQQDAVALKGWAIPAATDIAFVLGILMLLGDRVPISLKIFLASLAIFDDIGAIVIIALFYTSKISVTALFVVAVSIAILAFMNRRGVVTKSIYLLIGVVMWVAMLKSGVHATLAGVILAFFIPMKNPDNPDHSPLKDLEHDLHSVVAYVILPAFAFCNAGIYFGDVRISDITHPVTLGIAAGLFFGKQVGVFGLCWVAIKSGFCKLPDEVSWMQLYGAALLCGVGFTMSLFIGSLAFEEAGVNLMFDERLGIIFGSLISGLFGYLLLKRSLVTSSLVKSG